MQEFLNEDSVLKPPAVRLTDELPRLVELRALISRVPDTGRPKLSKLFSGPSVRVVVEKRPCRLCIFCAENVHDPFYIIE